MIYNKLIKSGCATHRRSVLISDIHTLSQPAHGLPSRSLSYTKIAQGECNGKGGKTCFYNFDTAELKLSLYKDRENKRHYKWHPPAFILQICYDTLTLINDKLHIVPESHFHR